MDDLRHLSLVAAPDCLEEATEQRPIVLELLGLAFCGDLTPLIERLVDDAFRLVSDALLARRASDALPASS